MDVVILRVTTAVVSAGIVCIADNGRMASDCYCVLCTVYSTYKTCCYSSRWNGLWQFSGALRTATVSQHGTGDNAQ